MTAAVHTTLAAPAGAEPELPALGFGGVSKRFDTGTEALHDVSFAVAAGELVGVVGPSGCGKSTLLRLAARLTKPTAGEITLRSDRLAYVFQDPTLLPWRSALANVELVAQLHGMGKTERRSRAQAALDRVGLTGFEQALPAKLSGGMRMRVSLARAFVLTPDLFLFDEPFGALDEITRLRMQDELQQLMQSGSYSGLFITHSVAEAVYLSSRVVVMSARPGRIVHEVTVPFASPRAPEIRYDPAFARLAGEVSAALLEGHS